METAGQQKAIAHLPAGTAKLALKDAQLVAKGEHFQREAGVRPPPDHEPVEH